MLRLLLTVILFSFVALHAADVTELIKKLPAQTAADRDAICADLFKEGAAGIQAISKLLVEPGKGEDSKARFALHGMAIHVSRPGGDADRKLFSETVAGELSGGAGPLVKAFLLTQLRLTAGDDQVAEIAKLLGDAELSEHAAQTLLTIRTPGVAHAFRAALESAKDGPRVTIINALGTLRDTAAVPALLKDAESADAAVKNAALHALASIGEASVAPALEKAASVDDWYDRTQATQATLTLAQRLVELGKTGEGAAICRELIRTHIGDKEHHVQCAALNILAAAQAEGAFDDLKAALKNESVEVRVTALNIAGAIPGAAVTKQWVAELKGADPKFAAEILGVLQRRGDASAFPAIADAVKSADKGVRLAAIRACVAGGKDALPVLLGVLGEDAKVENAEELAAARVSVSRLKGDGINAAIAAAIKGASPNLRKALINAIADRGSVENLNVLTAALTDPDAGIRAIAFDGIGFLGSVKELGPLLDVIAKTDKDDDRASAEKAAAAIAARTENHAASVPLIVAAMNGASTKAKQAFLRVLGKIGGAEALAALKPALKDANADVADSAVRELANWPDSSAEPELLDIAKNTTILTQNVLALNGYVRLVQAESKRPMNEFLPKYAAALELCRRPDEKKKVLSGIQTIKTPEAFKTVEALMGDEALREEACNAAMSIAKELAKSNKGAAREAFQKIIDTTKRENFKKDAQTELDKLPKK